MAIRNALPRLMLLPVFAGALVLGQASSATAQTATAAATTCVGSSAVSDVVYSVSGSTASVDFRVAPGCEDTIISLAAYKAPSDLVTGNYSLTDHQSGTFAADGQVHSLQVNLLKCNYAVDFATGPVISTLTPTNDYGSNLIKADNGNLPTCDVTTGDNSVVLTPEIPATDTPAPEDVALPTEVLGEVIEADTTQSADALAATGINTELMLGIGAGLILVGELLSRTSVRIRRNRA